MHAKAFYGNKVGILNANKKSVKGPISQLREQLILWETLVLN